MALSDEPMRIGGQVVPPVYKVPVYLNFSREVLGLVEEDPAARAARVAAYRAKQIDAWATYDAAKPLLEGIEDPLAHAVLMLHRPEDPEDRIRCEGCDMDGYEAEAPEWPCRTVRLVAEHYGIELPDPSYLWRRP